MIIHDSHIMIKYTWLQYYFSTLRIDVMMTRFTVEMSNDVDITEFIWDGHFLGCTAHVAVLKWFVSERMECCNTFGSWVYHMTRAEI